MQSMKRHLGSLGLLFVLSLLQPPAVDATVIHYQAVDLPDVEVGEDLWQYQYFVSGSAFNVDQGFAVYFDDASYDELHGAIPGAASTEWDVQLFAVSPIDGAYDALALVTGASLAQEFSVKFTWLGLGTPGSQPFEVYYLDRETLPGGVPEPIEEGTTSPIPEPSTLLLVGSGVAAVLRRRHRSA